MNEFDNEKDNLTNGEQEPAVQNVENAQNVQNAENTAAFTQDVSGNNDSEQQNKQGSDPQGTDACKSCIYATADGKASATSDFCKRCANNTAQANTAQPAAPSQAPANPYSSNANATQTPSNPYTNGGEGEKVSSFEDKSNPYVRATPYQDAGNGNAVPYETYKPVEGSVTAYPEKKEGQRAGFAVASLVLGILSIVCCCLPSNPILSIIFFVMPILAIVFGVLSLVKHKNGLAIAGIITGSIGLLIGLVFFGFGIYANSDAGKEWYDSLMESLSRELNSGSDSGSGVIDTIKFLLKK